MSSSIFSDEFMEELDDVKEESILQRVRAIKEKERQDAIDAMATLYT